MKCNDKSGNANFRFSKILIVEDNDDQWVIIQQALRQCLSEITVVRAATVQKAITLLETWRHQEWETPKLILLDLYIPEKTDGWQLLRHIKTMSANYSRIPIVVFSSSNVNSDIVESYQLGVSSYVVKPTNFADWLAYLQELRSYWWETVTLPPVQYGF
ncbi:response regulator [Spirosoma sp.]|uniref:response regulator n=1 Tax=Spirosoma sp. TaxID=1899569 RepID=UPI003B3BB8BE